MSNICMAAALKEKQLEYKNVVDKKRKKKVPNGVLKNKKTPSVLMSVITRDSCVCKSDIYKWHHGIFDQGRVQIAYFPEYSLVP